MARYANGRVPKNKLVYDRHGNPWFPGTYNKWVRFQKRVHDLRGKWLYITPKAHGAYNTYRDYDGQVSIRAALGINAAVPGNSSHGGVWTGQTTRWGWVSNVEAGAFDVSGWDEDDWPAMVKAAEEVGLHADIVVPRERWHFVDLEPWASGIPANVDTQPIELPEDELDKNQAKQLEMAHNYSKAVFESVAISTKDRERADGVLTSMIRTNFQTLKRQNENNARRLEAQDAAIATLTKLLSESAGVNPDTVEKAVRDEMRAWLDKHTISVKVE